MQRLRLFVYWNFKEICHTLSLLGVGLFFSILAYEAFTQINGLIGIVVALVTLPLITHMVVDIWD